MVRVDGDEGRQPRALASATEPPSALTSVCGECSSENPAGFRFCGRCGAALIEPAPRRAHKIVTILFCDVTGSTALSEELDPEVLRGVMNRYFAELRGTIERHGGTVEKFIGDAVMAVFGIPRVREDDALRAVRAAAEIRERLPAVAAEAGLALRFRTGVNTGGVFAGEGETLAVGHAVNVAARLEQAAQPGEILLGADTLSLVRDAVEVEALQPLAVKGKSEPLRAFRLLRMDPIAPGLARRLDRPLVGREGELAVLREVWGWTVERSDCYVCTILGAAGVGKSRLVAELLEVVGGAAGVLRARCAQYGQGFTFGPLIDALAPAGGLAEPVVERLRSGGAPIPEELFLDVRRLLESLARERPVILHIDDLQWAQPLLLDLLDHIAELSRSVPILLLCAARPEFVDKRRGWGAGARNSMTIRLGPLSAPECDVLLDQLGDRLDPQTRAQVVAASDGNPLFLEEMAALARESGTVRVPPSIHALLAARLEGLAREEREVLERGAVEGRVFHRLAVRALADECLASEVESRLAGLIRNELIRPHPPKVRGDEAFRFRHLLIRDAAYEALPKATRGDLHERFANWLVEAAGELAELDEIVGGHLEQAVRYQRELTRDLAPELTRRAARHLYAAGRRARECGNLPATRDLLERAFALTPDGDTLRLCIGVDLVERLIDAGEFVRADELLSAVERDPETIALAALSRFEWLVRVRPHEAKQTMESKLPGILEGFARVGDQRGIAKAHMAAFWVHRLACRWTAAGEEAGLAAHHAENAGDEGLRTRALGLYVVSIMYGRQHAEAIAQQLDAIERARPGPYLAAYVDRGRSEVARLAGRFNDARRLTQRAIESFQALGMPEMAALCELDLARTEMSAQQPANAVAALRRGDGILAGIGERSLRSAIHALLALAHAQLQQRDAAKAAIDLAEGLGSARDVLTNAITHQVRALFALANRDRAGAERWSRSAVQHALLTDDLVVQARARLGRSRVMSALGQTDEATTEARAALELFVAKGDYPGHNQARRLLGELTI